MNFLIFMSDFAKFLSVNGLKRAEIATYLGTSGAFVSQIASGSRPLPSEKLAKIKANTFGWDVSMLTKGSKSKQLHGLDVSGLVHTPAVSLRSAIEKTTKAEDALVGYLKLEIENLKAQISQLQNEKADLSKQVGMLEAKVELLSDGRLNVTFTPGDAK